jgi:hypothetical protein
MLVTARSFMFRVFYGFCLLFTADLICNYDENSISSLRLTLVTYFTVDLNIKDQSKNCQPTYGAIKHNKISYFQNICILKPWSRRDFMS